MKKRLLLISYLFIFHYGILVSQNSVIPESLTFDQAVSIAIRNNPDLKIKDLDNLIAAEQYNEARLKLVPQIYGRYDLQRNLIIPSTLVPIGKFNPDFPSDELTPIRFGTNWASIAGLFASVKIFDPVIMGDIREKRAAMTLTEVEKKITQTDLETETGKAYANCLLSLEQVKFAANDTINSFRQLSESYLKFSSGMLKQTDLNQAVINHSNSVSRFNEASKIYSDSRKTLAYWMNAGETDFEAVTLSDSLNQLIDRLGNHGKEVNDIRSSLTYQRLEAQDNIDNLKLKNVKAGFLPAISLNGILSTDYYNNQFNLTNGEYWFGNSNINLSLHLPITEGIERTKRIRQQKYRIEANKYELSSALGKKQLEMNRISDNIEFYRKEIIIKKSSLELAGYNYEASFSLFREGRLLPSGLSEAELSLRQTKIDYLKALYNYIDSLLELKKIIRS